MSNSQLVSSVKMAAIKQEVERAGREMQSYRPGEPFTELEKAFGYAAFMKWLALSVQKQQRNDPDFYEFYEGCNQSAKEIALTFMDLAFHDRAISGMLSRKYEELDGAKEVKLGLNAAVASFNPEWHSSLTRAVVMVCRQMAYFYTGVLGDTFELKGKNISWQELNDASVQWLDEVLKEKPEPRKNSKWTRFFGK